MADLTKQVEVVGTWKEITVPLALEDKKTYAIDVAQVSDPKSILYQAETDSETVGPSDSIIGHPWFLKSQDRYIDTRIYTKREDAYVWVRVTRGTATVVATEIE